MIRLFLLGGPGSGKSEVSRLLIEAIEAEIRYYNVGGILRKQASKDEHIKKVHAEGGLVNSDRVLSIFNEALQQDNFLCDGSPRRPAEATYILNHPLWNKEPGYLIHLDLDEDIAKERLLARGRFDDKEEIINRRIVEYKEVTLQSVRLFDKSKRVITIHATSTPDVVCSTILKALSLI